MYDKSINKIDNDPKLSDSKLQRSLNAKLKKTCEIDDKLNKESVNGVNRLQQNEIKK